MQPNVYVVHTADRKEMIALTPIIHLLSKDHNLLFVRAGADKKIAEIALIDEVRDLVFPPSTGLLLSPMILGLAKTSLKKELEKLEVKMIGFIGSDPELVTKKPNVEKLDTYMRIARVCCKCEGVIKSEENYVKLSRAHEVRDQYRDDADADVTMASNYLNILIKDECPTGC